MGGDKMVKHTQKEKNIMINYYNSISEKDRRRYAAVEAMHYGYGGQQYISELLGCDPRVIKKGLEELENNTLDDLNDRIRAEGGGRKKIIDTTANIDEVFLKVLKNYTAGDPMDDKVRWTNLTQKEIAMHMKENGIIISEHVVKKLLEKHNYGKRQAVKNQTKKSVENRNEQFEKIDQLKEKYLGSDINPVISIDTKKKEFIGNLYRSGSCYVQEPINVYDHDFPSYAKGKIVPHGIYDLKSNETYLTIGTSKDTTEFACDNLKDWWNNIGKKLYPNATSILVLADGGGSNSSRYYIFKKDLQDLANEIGIEIRMAHYPPYCSKYNPIEHRAFCHISRAWDGVIFKSIDIVKELAEKVTTSTGFRVIAQIKDKVFQTKRKVTDKFKDNMPIIKDEYLGQWNYRAVPKNK
jgi:hypothetical protein